MRNLSSHIRLGKQTDTQLFFENQTEAFLVYLKTVRNLSVHTVRAYKDDLSDFIRWLKQQNIDPFEISHRQLRQWLAYLTSARYATSTIDRKLCALRSLYRWLTHEKVIKSDPAAAVMSPKLPKTLPKTLSAEDVDKLLAHVDTSYPKGIRDRCFLELLAASGARISEISALNVGDIDFTSRQVRLFGKGSKERIVPLYNAALSICRSYLEQARPSLLKQNIQTDAFFLSTRGQRMSADALRTCFNTYLLKAGLDPHLTPHAMRHSFATELLAGGADMRSVQELLGHASLATTQIYTHLTIERLKSATKKAHPRAQE